jgi:hypothetical protein
MRGSLRRISVRTGLFHLREAGLGDIARIGFKQDVAAAGKIETEIDPGDLVAGLTKRASIASGIRLGIAISTPASSISDIDQTFQRGKSSMAGSVVSRLGGTHVGERRLDHADADIGCDLDLDLKPSSTFVTLPMTGHRR